MHGFELVAIAVAPSDFHDFFEVAAGHRKHAVNRARGNFLSSLSSLLSFPCSLPSALGPEMTPPEAPSGGNMV